MEINKTHYHNDAVKRREKLETALARLQSLKCKVSELRLQCEALKKQELEKKKKALVCNECGKLIEQGNEVTIKDTHGEVRSCYHKDCFKAILFS